VNALPSAAVPELLHVYVLFTLSVTVPSPLSTNRRVVDVVLVVVVLLLVVVVGAAHSPAVQAPLQHC